MMENSKKETATETEQEKVKEETVEKISDDIYIINKHAPCSQQTQQCHHLNHGETAYLCCKNNLIELLSYIIEVLDENNITYFLDYGTLLGCVRNNSFIPWDEDIDISIINNSRFASARVMKIISENNKNYHLVRDRKHHFYKLFFSQKNLLHIDISIRKKQKNNVYTDKYSEKYWGIHEEDLFPLKTTTFENLTVKIPFNSKKYLENGYGLNCITNTKIKGEYKEHWYR